MQTRKINQHIEFYTARKIQEWKDLSIALPQDIESLSHQISEKNKKLTVAQKKLSLLLNQKLKPIQEKIASIQAQIQALTLPEQIKKQKEKILALTTHIEKQEAPIEKFIAPLKQLTQKKSALQERLDIKKHTTFINHLSQTRKMIFCKLNALEEKTHSDNDDIKPLQSTISHLHQEIKKLTQSIATHETMLNNFSTTQKQLAFSESIPNLKSKLISCNEHIQALERKKISLEGPLNHDKKALALLQKKLENEENGFIFYKNLANTFSQNMDPDDLNHQLKIQTENQSAALAQKKQIKENITHIEKIIHQIQLQKKLTENALTALNKEIFLKNLWQTPEKMTHLLADTIEEKLIQFENQLLFDQKKQTLLTIANIRRQIKIIIYQDNINKELSSNAQQEKFYQLCGLLWQQLNERIEAAEISALMEDLKILLRKNPIATDFSIAAYKKLNLPCLTYEELAEQTRANYFAERDKLEAILRPLANSPHKTDLNLYHTGERLIDLLEEQREKYHQQKKPDNFNFGYYAKFLQTATLLAQHPHVPETQQLFTRLIQQIPDNKSSLGKKIVGISLMLLGAAFMVGAFFTIPGLLIGIGIGTGLIVTGGAIFGASIGKCPHKKMNAYATATKHATFFSANTQSPTTNTAPQSPLAAPPPPCLSTTMESTRTTQLLSRSLCLTPVSV